MLATLSFAFTDLAESSTVLSPSQQEQVTTVLEDDAQVLSDTQLTELLEDESPAVQQEILDINEDARPRALQAALIVALVAALIGVGLALRMRRQPDPQPSDNAATSFG